MSPNKFCPYCGNPVKQTDKFCIICGKPMLIGIPKPEKAPEIKDTKKEKEKKETKEKLDELISDEKIEKEERLEEKSVEKEKKKGKKGKEKEEVKPLPEEVKEQIVFYIEYNDIQLNKKLLTEKLDEILKSTKDSRYEWDNNFKKEVNIKLEAVKALIEELKQNETVIKQKMEEPFIVQKLNSNIESKIFQLENLTREHKLHKIDRETFEKLREKYKQEKTDLETEKEELVIGMKLWIQELKLEKAELASERKLNKGRFSAKEISEEEYKENDKNFNLKLKKITAKVDKLEELTK
ncbi:MAG: zinc-ribbon domain-containing protein [Promethearchaeota archaeon]